MNLNQMVVDYVNKIGFEEASRVFNRDKQTIVMWLKTGSIPLSAAQVVLNQVEEPKLDGGLFFPEKESRPAGVFDATKLDNFTEPPREDRQAILEEMSKASAPKVEIAPYPQLPLTPLGEWQKEAEARLDKLEAFARRMTDPDRIRPSLAQPPTEVISKQAIPHPLMEPVIEGGNPARGDEDVVELPNANRDWNQPYRDYSEDGRRQVGR